MIETFISALLFDLSEWSGLYTDLACSLVNPVISFKKSKQKTPAITQFIPNRRNAPVGLTKSNNVYVVSASKRLVPQSIMFATLKPAASDVRPMYE